MTKKRYKKLLMSTGINRNQAEILTRWGRMNNIRISVGYKYLDAFCLGYLYAFTPIQKMLEAVKPLADSVLISSRGGDAYA